MNVIDRENDGTVYIGYSDEEEREYYSDEYDTEDMYDYDGEEPDENNEPHRDRLSTAEAMRILNDAFCTDDNIIFDYKKLQDNLRLYKEGSREATEYIVKVFHKFTINKYARFIHMGHVPYFTKKFKSGKSKTMIDPSISMFIKLYTKKEDKEKHPLRSQCFSAVCNKIVTLFSKYDYCDIYNEMVLALLNMASRYKILEEGDKYYTETGTFPMYIKKCFHWEAKRQLDKLITDPLAHNESIHIIDDFSELSDDEYDNYQELLVQDEKVAEDFKEATSRADIAMRVKFSDKLKNREIHSEYDDMFLDFNWTNGITCSELFADLTPMEREILVLVYMKKIPVDIVARNYKCSDSSIFNYKNKAIAKIVLKAKELGVNL